MVRQQDNEGEGCIDLLERAVFLLRSIPLHGFLLYYAGAIPFLIGLLFFIADMSASPFAKGHCAAASLGVTLLYIWMRTWHTLFCRRLLNEFGLAEAVRHPLRMVFRLAAFHMIYSSWSIIILPLSMVIALPYAWVLAYLNNLCMVDTEEKSFKEAAAHARRSSRPWPVQNHYVVLILGVCWMVVVINLITALIQGPNLLKQIAGVETSFSQMSGWMMNSTFLCIVIALAHLVIDPLVKAVYVIRFNRIDSITTGDDILASLRRLPPKRRLAGAGRAIAVLGFLLLLQPVQPAWSDASGESSISVEQLDRTIDDVMTEREFTWRMPRDYVVDEDLESGFFQQFSRSVADWVEASFEKIGEWIDRFYDWLTRHDEDRSEKDRNRNNGGLSPEFFKGLSVVLLVALVAVLIYAIVRMIMNRHGGVGDVREAQPVRVSVDLDAEDLVATLLEEDEWVRLAREMAAGGELRKSIRAWFLAAVSALSHRDLLAVKRSKSNLDYRRELARRARRRPELIPLFDDSIMVYERAWYGLHAVMQDDLVRMEKNLEGLRREEIA
ncbi:MAG: hypothetical protein JXR25_14385 [Pontiellaceae bacterium]|nr:hypothetical protein [Pontiellaceae bacterium]MBN2786007.1 hypothetical protein [Pontiellaceae bacterium]